jgi:hypothetical protein
MKQTRQTVHAIKQPILLRCLWNKYIATIVINLMTPKAAAKRELLFNKPALGLTFTKAALKLLTIVFFEMNAARTEKYKNLFSQLFVFKSPLPL